MNIEKEAEKVKNASISEKINFWLRIAEHNIFKPLENEFGDDWRSDRKADIEFKGILTTLYGLNYNVVHPLLIPESYYKEHFENELNNPEFTYWILQYNAKIYLKTVILHSPDFREKLNGNLAELFIKTELEKLIGFEKRVESLVIDGKIKNIYDSYTYSEFADEIEYLRIKNGYYERNPLKDLSICSRIVKIFAEHIYLKKFIEDELKKFIDNRTTKKQPTAKTRTLFLQYAFLNKKFDEDKTRKFNRGTFDKEIKGFIKEKENDYGFSLYQPFREAQINAEQKNVNFDYDTRNEAIELYTTIFKEAPKKTSYQ